MGEGRGVIEAMAVCETCNGTGSVECGTMHPGGCANDNCRGYCEVACNDCTGEGMVPELRRPGR